MANSFDSNFTRMLARIFLDKFESARVLSKNVNTQLLKGRFSPKSGTIVDFKRPTDYVSVRTSGGDLTSAGVNDIITGKASGIVQDYFTVNVEYDAIDEALKMDQLPELLAPMATRIVTDLEIDFAAFMMVNSAQLAGTVGTAVSTWSDVAEAGSVLAANGIPADDMWIYTVNPFTEAVLADIQRSLGSGGAAGALISEAHRKAIITDDFAGMRVMKATTLASYTLPTLSDLVGALNGLPAGGYLTAKDTMTQTLIVDGFTDSVTLPAGTQIQVTGRNRLNLSTRQVVLNASISAVAWTATLVADAVLTSGAGTLIVSGPAINETDGQYQTVSSALADNDVVTILGSSAATLQPNLFWHKQAFSIGSVPQTKLHSTDTLATTEDGLQIRVSKGADFTKNQQKVRFDLVPAYGVMNPFFAGHGYG